MAKCKVCGKGKEQDDKICSSCTEFFKAKYGKNYDKKIDLFLERLEEFELNYTGGKK